MAATSIHGPGPGAQAQGQYSSAVFQALDDKLPSRSPSASTAPRDSPFTHHIPTPTPPPAPTALSAGPFTFRADARLTPFPSTLPRNPDCNAPAAAPVAATRAFDHLHPSDLEATQSLIRLSSTIDPITVLPRDDYLQSLPSPRSAHLVANSLLKTDPEASPHPSTSPDDTHGRRSDVFSVVDNSDTISDPDVEADRSFPQPMPPASLLQEIATHTPLESLRAAPNGHSTAEHYRTQPPRKLYDPSAPVIPLSGTQCTCHGVPGEPLRILNAPNNHTLNIEHLINFYRIWKDSMCSLHKDAYTTLITDALDTSQPTPLAVTALRPVVHSPTLRDQPEREQKVQRLLYLDHEPVVTGSGTAWRSVPYRRRETSIPGFYEYELDALHPVKRPRLDESLGLVSNAHPANQASSGIQSSRRPQVDPGFDEGFRLQVLGELAHDFTDGDEDDWSRGECTNRYIHKILSQCKIPNSDIRRGPVEAGFLSGREAAEAVESGIENIPIFTEGQQHFQWNQATRPITQLFSRMEDLSREVSVQIPSHGFELPSYENKTLAEIQERLSTESISPDPWNILDLRSPLPPSILPSFLTGENCQLLPRIRDSILEGSNAERTKAHRADWNEWTDLLEWVLMSEGGHNTAPHMDSHGWSTWITIQEGNFGFGWLSRPTDKEREAWMANPLACTEGNWRFAILKPGQTVFFPSGTIHFVFRLHDKQTLALGGHLLQWTQLERWVEVIQWQLKNPNITNEDLGTSPLKYLHMAEQLVANRVGTFSRVQAMGGMSTVNSFRVRKSEVERWFKRKQKKRKR